MHRASDQMNRNMYMLSVVAAIMLPLGFITGLLGINVGGLPLTHSTNGFWIVTGALVILVAIQVYFFRKQKWL
jgi:zinc transporter